MNPFAEEWGQGIVEFTRRAIERKRQQKIREEEERQLRIATVQSEKLRAEARAIAKQRQQLEKEDREEKRPGILAAIEDGIVAYVNSFVPKADPIFSVRADDVVPDRGVLVREIMALCWPYRHYVGDEIRAYEASIDEVSQEVLTKGEFERGKRVYPIEYNKRDDVIVRYLYNTSFFFLIETMLVRVGIPNHVRFEHQFVLGPSGTGKTTLLFAQLLPDLEKVARGKCAIVIMDGKGDLIKQVANLAAFGPGGELEGKLVYLEPDTLHPLALNLFDIGDLPDEANQRAIAKREIEESILSSLTTMSTAGDSMVRFLVQLCMQIDGATIETLMELLTPEGFKKHSKHLPKLSTRAQLYFSSTFTQSSRQATKDALLSRLNEAMSVDAFADMFVSKVSKFSLLRAIEKPCVIIINTNRQLLGAAGCEMFGRFFLSQLLHASLHRDGSSLPLLCYVDECHHYIARDDAIAEHLTQMRSRRIGLIFATQMWEWITSAKVKQALLDCAIKFSAERKKQKRKGDFQCEVSGYFDNRSMAVQVIEPPSQPRVSKAAFETLKVEMRRRYCTRAMMPIGGPASEHRTRDIEQTTSADHTAPNKSRREIVRECGAALADYWPDFEDAVAGASGTIGEEKLFQYIDKIDISNADKTRLHELRRQRNRMLHPPQEVFPVEEWSREIVHYTKLFNDLVERRRTSDPAAASPER
jgi:hypothetical protein